MKQKRKGKRLSGMESNDTQQMAPFIYNHILFPLNIINSLFSPMHSRVTLAAHTTRSFVLKRQHLNNFFINAENAAIYL